VKQILTLIFVPLIILICIIVYKRYVEKRKYQHPLCQRLHGKAER